MVGFALIHVEPYHFKTFANKLWDLGLISRSLKPGQKITDVQPIYRLYSGGREGYEEFHAIVYVEANDVTGLREIFGSLEDAGCHIDGYGG